MAASKGGEGPITSALASADDLAGVTSRLGDLKLQARNVLQHGQE